jgi:hypothetical protein
MQIYYFPLIIYDKGHIFSGLWKTIRLHTTIPDLLKYLTDCLNKKKIVLDILNI